MRGNRVLILVGFVVFAVAAAAGVFYWRSTQNNSTPDVVEPVDDQGQVQSTPTPPPGLVQIVVSVQNIPRGMRITEASGAVAMFSWPQDNVPPGVIVELGAVYDKIAKVDIVRGQPVVQDMLAVEMGDMGATGSHASLYIPNGKRAYPVEVNQHSSVAWALQPGDHVDVIMSFEFVDIDEEFQAPLPNQQFCLTTESGCQNGPQGRIEVLPSGDIVSVSGSTPQQPRRATQFTVQNAVVLLVGEWPMDGSYPIGGAPVATPPPEEQVEGEETPPPARNPVEPVTLVVDPQEALVLELARQMGAQITLVLRPAGDEALVTSSSATLQYIMDTYGIGLPDKLPYGQPQQTQQ